MSDQVYWLLELNVNSGKSQSGKDLMDEMVAATKASEPGTLNYEWNMNSDETVIHIFERYADSAATLAHLGNFGANFAERFMECFSLVGFKVYGNPSSEVVSAVSGFGADCYSSVAGFSRS